MSYNSLFGLGTHSADADLQGWWKMDDNAASTTVTDSSGNGHDATLDTGTTASIATTGHKWFGSAFDLPAASKISVSDPDIDVGAECTFIFWANDLTSLSGNVAGRWTNNSQDRSFLFVADYASSDGLACIYDSGIREIASPANEYGNWTNYCLSRSSSSGTYYRNGSSIGSGVTNGKANNCPLYWGGHGGATSSTDITFGESAYFSRELSADEYVEAYSGPEPLNLTAPTLSQGTYTISTTSGAWDSQANGTVSYTYSWEYADDASGTNPVAISAVASTISPTSAMSGKFIRVTVSASNDGGSDSAEDQVSAWTAITAVPRGLGSEVAQWCPSWQDDSAESTVTDYTGNGHDLTNYNTGAGNWVADTNEGGVRAVDLNGVDEYHSGSAALDGLVGTDFTLSIWTKKDNTNGGHMLGLYQDQFGISTTQDHHALWHSTSSTYGTSALSYRNTAINRLVHASNQAPSNPTTWRHILATYSWSGSTLTITLYIDGVQIASQLGAVTIDYAMNLTAIGANIRLNGPTAFLDGRWDDARIFNSVLTQDEITHLASARGVEGSPGGGPTFKPFFAINATRIVR